jgi:hypothetical protein
MKNSKHRGGRPATITPERERRQRITVVLDRKSYHAYSKLTRKQHTSMSGDLRKEVRRKLAAQ